MAFKRVLGPKNGGGWWVTFRFLGKRGVAFAKQKNTVKIIDFRQFPCLIIGNSLIFTVRLRKKGGVVRFFVRKNGSGLDEALKKVKVA